MKHYNFKLPNISTEEARLEVELALEEEKICNDIHHIQMLYNQMSSSARHRLQTSTSMSNFELALEDLDGEDKNIFKRIFKRFKNIWEDIKSVRENFEIYSHREMLDAIDRLKQCQNLTGYQDPKTIDDDSILNVLSVYNRLGVMSNYSGESFAKYLQWGVDQITDKYALKTILDHIISFLMHSSKYSDPARDNIGLLDKIKDKEIRDWLSKRTKTGVVARISGPNTYLVTIKDASVFETWTSGSGGLKLSSSVLRVDNYSCKPAAPFKSLSEAEIKKLVKDLISITDQKDRMIDTIDTNIILDKNIGSAFPALLRIFIHALAPASILPAISHYRTCFKIGSDFLISYVKYLNAMVKLIKLHYKN